MKKAFTLIELLVVISIVGVLSAIVLASLSSSYAKAKAARALTFYKHSTSALSDDAIVLMNFNETGGTIASDTSGLSNNGTLVGGALWQPGKFGNAIYFDGVDDGVNLVSGYRPNQESFTVSAWFNLDPSVSGTGSYFPIFGNDQAIPLLGYIPTSRQFMNFRQWTGGSENLFWSASSLPNLADGSWHYVLMTVDQSASPRSSEVFIDGQSLGKQYATSNEGYTHGNGDLIRIGHMYTTSAKWKGMIDEAGVYKGALFK